MQMELRSLKSDCKGTCTSFDTLSQLHVYSGHHKVTFTIKALIKFHTNEGLVVWRYISLGCLQFMYFQVPIYCQCVLKHCGVHI